MAVGGWLLASLSALLGVWTLMHNPVGNFNIRPAPKPTGVLVTTGPYQFIRHPMYTSVLLIAAALAFASEPLFSWLMWGALALVLFVKAQLEERWMREQHPGYGAYCDKTQRFLPWLI